MDESRIAEIVASAVARFRGFGGPTRTVTAAIEGSFNFPLSTSVEEVVRFIIEKTEEEA